MLNVVWLLFVMLLSISDLNSAERLVITGKDLAVAVVACRDTILELKKKAVTAYPGIIRVFA